jgi:plasmid stability protein
MNKATPRSRAEVENDDGIRVFTLKLPATLLKPLRARAARETRSVGSVVRQLLLEAQRRGDLDVLVEVDDSCVADKIKDEPLPKKPTSRSRVDVTPITRTPALVTPAADPPILPLPLLRAAF